MEKITYDENLVTIPTGTQYHEQMDSIRSELLRVEVERDEAILLLTEIYDADEEDLVDIINKVREFVEGTPYVSPF